MNELCKMNFQLLNKMKFSSLEYMITMRHIVKDKWFFKRKGKISDAAIWHHYTTNNAWWMTRIRYKYVRLHNYYGPT